ncbi:hypothetical protein AgCh_017161 [Apium graveolens]
MFDAPLSPDVAQRLNEGLQLIIDGGSTHHETGPIQGPEHSHSHAVDNVCTIRSPNSIMSHAQIKVFSQGMSRDLLPASLESLQDHLQVNNGVLTLVPNDTNVEATETVIPNATIVGHEGKEELVKVLVIYSQLPFSCSLCKAFGHFQSHCANNPDTMRPAPRARNRSGAGTQPHTNGSQMDSPSNRVTIDPQTDARCAETAQLVGDKGFETPFVDDINPTIIGEFAGCDVVLDDDQHRDDIHINELKQVNNDLEDDLENIDAMPTVQAPPLDTIEHEAQDEDIEALPRRKITRSKSTTTTVEETPVHKEVAIGLGVSTPKPNIPKPHSKAITDDDGFTLVVNRKSPKLGGNQLFFADLNESAWQVDLFGDPMVVLARKIKLTKNALKKLNKNHGDINDNVTSARASLREVLVFHKDCYLLALEKSLSDKLAQCLLQQEHFLLQNARVKWMHKGDGNSSFFFNQCKKNWNFSKVLALEDSMGLVHGQANCATVAVNYFTEFLGKASPCVDANLSSIHCPTIIEAPSCQLEAPVTNDLIHSTLKKMKKNKASGPDGLNVEFFLETWHITGPSFCEVVHAFFETSTMHSLHNSTFIALIPKIQTPTQMIHFPPISLCTIFYKCVSKILASRLKTVLPSLIDVAQSAFILGRVISDNFLLAQELFRGYDRVTGALRCALKIDLHKAFDSLQWNFVLASLDNMGFNSTFISWIKACICTPKFSMKLYGIVHGYFAGAQGIHQGDPMSPYLFTLYMNVLSCLLKPKPPNFKYHFKCKHMDITHLFFADDVLFFALANVDSVKHIIDNIALFSSMNGLTPSIHKSSSFICNASADFLLWFDTTYGIPRGSMPVKFLGVPLISAQLCINDCIPLIDKLSARINSWTSLLLSFAGRVRLIKSVLTAIQAYWCNHFMLPAAMHAHIQSLLTRFLWRGNINQKGGAKIAWTTVCLPKEEGGLGVKKHDLLESCSNIGAFTQDYH